MKLFGIPVQINNVVCRGRPRMKCSVKFSIIQNPKLVEETNAWMREFFGVEPNQVFLITDPVTGQKTYFMCQEDFDKIRRAEHNHAIL